MDIELIKNLCQLTDKELKTVLYNFLKKKYETVYNTNAYIFAEGTLPICLVAHLDTVFIKPPTEIYYDEKMQVLWSPQGLGADDRAGVYAILEILEAGYRPSIIFTMAEEKGGLGAKQLVKDIPDCPFVGLKAIIQLDRQGKDDCVFYDCDNDDFTKFIESFGFNTDIGSYSDISFIAPAWSVAAVNLSVGYVNEHSYSERLFVEDLENTIYKVKEILRNCISMQSYAYIPFDYEIDRCAICGKKIFNKNEIKTYDTFKICTDCFTLFGIIDNI